MVQTMTTITEYENGRMGIVSADGSPVLTYKIQSQAPEDETLELSPFMGGGVNGVARIGNYSIALYGDHNNLPLELKNTVKANRLLPEILEKQRKYLYGKGPYFYTEKATEDNKITRVPASIEHDKLVKRATKWLNSWQELGAKDDYKAYLRKQIGEFYYCENVMSLKQFNKSRRLLHEGISIAGENAEMPVRYLESIPNTIGRLATEKDLSEIDVVEISDFDSILVGNWGKYWKKDKKLYPLFDRKNKYKYPVVVAMDKNDSFGEMIYGFAAWFFGLKDWIKMSNLDPKYVNSYLKNSLGAKLQVLIPQAWCDQYRTMIEDACRINAARQDDNKPLLKFGGEIEIGTEYQETFLDQLIQRHLNKIVKLMSGEGKNQGKIWSTRKFNGPEGTEEWEIREIPNKLNDYITTLIKLDERADQVLLEGKGMDPSLSNVSKEGIISKSGADLYYNYLLYLDNLQIPEEIVLKHINEALAMNFPELVANDIKLGFYHNVIQRQEDVAPNNRMNQTVGS
jgi:hypothetical protein